MATKKQRAIISLGGSLLVPGAIDTHFIMTVRSMIRRLTRTHAVVLFCGGGKTARAYQEALTTIEPKVANEGKDWVGIQSSILNATLLAQVFGDSADQRIITDPRVRLSWKKDIYIGAGWKPGRSTDYDAVRLAVENDVSVVVNLSNVEYVYSADPRTNPSAQRFEQLSWKDMRSIVGTEWTPGMNVPFDPIAAQLAEKHDVDVKFLHGQYLGELRKAIVGQRFHGTDISNAYPVVLAKK